MILGIIQFASKKPDVRVGCGKYERINSTYSIFTERFNTIK